MKIKFAVVLIAAVVFCTAAGSGALAQGKGGGNKGGGRSGNSGQSGNHGNSGNKSSSSSSASSDTVTSNDHGKPDKGEKNADKAAKNADKARDKAAKMSDNELNRYKGLSKKLGTTPEDMRSRYRTALLQNPDLSYGNFVSAHMVADNLGNRYPNVTSAALLDRMAKGRSLGQAMQDLKVAPTHITSTQTNIKTRMKGAGILTEN